MNLAVLLQASAAITEVAPQTVSTSYLTLLMKGGWIMVPIVLLSFTSIYIIFDRWVTINKLGGNDQVWFWHLLELISYNRRDEAIMMVRQKPYAIGQIVEAGLHESNVTDEQVENSMQIEARQQISMLESKMNYLAITASIAPMLGFLGTIFGVIRIFYNISMTNDLNIASISDGLYQKMICSGAGLFVGIIAFSGYSILNGRIDKIVARFDLAANQARKTINAVKSKQN